MNINFDAIEEKRMPGFKGGMGTTVGKLYECDTIKVLKGYLEKDSSIGMHTHEGSCETIYIFSGVGKVVYDGKEEQVFAGSCHYCPEGHTHSLINTGEEPLYFIGVIPNL